MIEVFFIFLSFVKGLEEKEFANCEKEYGTIEFRWDKSGTENYCFRNTFFYRILTTNNHGGAVYMSKENAKMGFDECSFFVCVVTGKFHGGGFYFAGKELIANRLCGIGCSSQGDASFGFIMCPNAQQNLSSALMCPNNPMSDPDGIIYYANSFSTCNYLNFSYNDKGELEVGHIAFRNSNVKISFSTHFKVKSYWVFSLIDESNVDFFCSNFVDSILSHPNGNIFHCEQSQCIIRNSTLIKCSGGFDLFNSSVTLVNCVVDIKKSSLFVVITKNVVLVTKTSTISISHPYFDFCHISPFSPTPSAAINATLTLPYQEKNEKHILSPPKKEFVYLLLMIAIPFTVFTIPILILCLTTKKKNSNFLTIDDSNIYVNE